MADPISISASPRSRSGIPTHRPRWGFFKGFATGAVIEVPILAATIWVLARLGIGNPDTPFMRLIRLTAVFAGIAAVFTAAGVGRLAAFASVDGGRRRAMFVAARAHAAASIGLVIIAAVPHGQLPEHHTGWLAFVGAGLVAGALAGAMIGAVCGGAAPVTLGDVLSLARRPTDALRQLVDPEDFVRVGARLRARTTHLFEGLFEPGPKRPKPEDAAKEPDKSDERRTRSGAGGGAKVDDKKPPA